MLKAVLSLWEQLPLPPPWTLTLESDVDKNLPTLLAPFVGFGVAISGTTSMPFTGMSGCVGAGYPRYSPSTALVGGTLFTYPAGELHSARIEQRRLWQPYPFNALNFLMDQPRTHSTGELASPQPPECRRSFIASGMEMPVKAQCIVIYGTDNQFPQWTDCDRSDPSKVLLGPDPASSPLGLLFEAFDRYGFEFNPATDCLHGSLRPFLPEGAESCNWTDPGVRGLCPVIEIARFPEHGVAAYHQFKPNPWNGCLDPRFQGPLPSDSPTIRHWDSQPRVFVADANGVPLSGRSCKVRARSLRDGLTRLRVEALCRETAPGVYTVEMLRVVDGGASSELQIDIFIDGVKAQQTNESWWRSDGNIDFISSSVPDMSKLDVIFLVGHSSFSFFALLSIPMFALNEPVLRLLSCAFAAIFLMLLLSYQASVLRTVFYFTTEPGRALMQATGAADRSILLAFGSNDMSAVGAVTGEPWFLGFSVGNSAHLFSFFFVTFPLLTVSIWLYTRAIVRWEPLRARLPTLFAYRRHLYETYHRLWGSDPLWRESDGLLEPTGTRRHSETGVLEPVFYESASECRRRLYRNHVRRLLRGTRWYEAEIARLKTERERRSIKGRIRRALARVGPIVVEPVIARARRCFQAGRLGRLAWQAHANGPGDGIPLLPTTSGGQSTVLPACHTSLPAATSALDASSRLPVASTAPPSPPPSPTQPSDIELLKVSKPSAHLPQGRKLHQRAGSVLTKVSDMAFDHMMHTQQQLKEKVSKLREAHKQEPKADRQDRSLPLDAGPVLLPQKMWMACALSTWLTLCLTLVVQNAKEWVVAALLSSYRLGVTLDAQSGLTDQLADATLLTSRPLLALLLASPLVSSATVRDQLVSAVATAFDAITLLNLLFVAYTWHGIFCSFRRHTRMIRRGEYFFPRGMNETSANRYIGYQVSHTTLAYLVMLAPLGTITFAIAILCLLANNVVEGGRQVFDGFTRALGSLVQLVLLLLVPILFQKVANMLFFRYRWVQHRALYALYDYNMIYVNALIGLAAVISRTTTVLFFSFVFFPRIDYSLLPGPTFEFLPYDTGFGAYVALLRLDHRYNNPVSVVFTDILIERMLRFRARRTQERNRARRDALLRMSTRGTRRKVAGADDRTDGVSATPEWFDHLATRHQQDGRCASASQASQASNQVRSLLTRASRAITIAPSSGDAGSNSPPSGAVGRVRALTATLRPGGPLDGKGEIRAGFDARFLWCVALAGAKMISRERREARRRLARNRWYLARLVLFNPSLRRADVFSASDHVDNDLHVPLAAGATVGPNIAGMAIVAAMLADAEVAND
jgi:hypothetical protein